MKATDQQINEWAGKLWSLKNEMEESAWNTQGETYQHGSLMLVHMAWKALHDEARARQQAGPGTPPTVEELFTSG
jgi:hypothetical protein